MNGGGSKIAGAMRVIGRTYGCALYAGLLNYTEGTMYCCLLLTAGKLHSAGSCFEDDVVFISQTIQLRPYLFMVVARYSALKARIPSCSSNLVNLDGNLAEMLLSPL